MIKHLEGLRDRLRVSLGQDVDRGSILRDSRELEIEAERLGFSPLSRQLRRIVLLIEFRDNLIDEAPAESSELTTVAIEELSRLARAFKMGEVRDSLPQVEDSSSIRWGELLRLLGVDEEDADVEIEQGGAIDQAEAPSEIAIGELIRLVSRNDEIRRVSEASRSSVEDKDDEPSMMGSDQLVELLLGGRDRAKPAHAPVARVVSSVFLQPTPPTEPLIPSSVDSINLDDLSLHGANDREYIQDESASSGELEPALEDPEIRESFRADCESLFERICPILEDLERGNQSPALYLELGRCLHTLKGASGAVGLLDLNVLIHNLEDMNEEAAQSTGPPPAEFLVRLNDLVLRTEGILSRFGNRANLRASRSELTEVGEQPSIEKGLSSTEGSPSSSSPSGSRRDESTTQDSDETVRVSVSRLGELMDLIAELFLQNSPRARMSEQVKELSAAARSCRNRLTASIDRLCDVYTSLNAERQPSNAGRDATSSGIHKEMVGLIRHLTEQADDLAIVAETARSLSAPMMDDADTSTRLVRQVWDLLHDIRVVPVRPLLQRLARVTRAASKIERKQVEVVLVGDELGLDRLIQDKIFEPLLHVVRNAVGHGIESPEVRTASGKSPMGRVILEAERDDQAFVFTVRDDGGGLDYPAIEAKARGVGLLGPTELASPQQLLEILFRPGFTTRRDVDSISGRGLGMDVVAQEVAQLQGTVRMVSEVGKGTSLSIRLPSQLTLEQSMIVTVDGQKFAIPLPSVDNDLGQGNPDGETRLTTPPVDARIALGLNLAPPSHVPKVLRVSIQGVKREVLVDSIDGPRELVARPLHPLLASHPVISGTSLASDGDLILLINPAGLARDEFASRTPAPARPLPALLVDDSISVRRSVYRHLKSLGLEVEEACDGVEALKMLRDRRYRFMITDIDMPRMTGFELLTELAKERPSSRPPVFVSSSRSDPQTRQTALSLGARAFIAKPIGMEELAEFVGPLLKVPSG